jgi:multiple sugar transport system permease protein
VSTAASTSPLVTSARGEVVRHASTPRLGRRMRASGRYAVLSVFVVLSLFPLYWIFTSSLMPTADVFRVPPAWTFPPSLVSYRTILGMVNKTNGGTDFVRYAVNSIVIAVGTAIPSLALGTMAAYGITRCRVRWGQRYLSGVLIGRLVPPVVLLVPLFSIWSALHMVDSQIAVIVTLLSFGLPFVIWMMSGFFNELPRELDEAAMVDGASRLTCLWRVIVPASVAGLTVTAFFVLLGAWNEYLIPIILTQNNAEPIAVAIQSYVSGFNTQWGELFAASTLAFLPVLVAGAFAQRYLVRGFTSGVLKG